MRCEETGGDLEVGEGRMEEKRREEKRTYSHIRKRKLLMPRIVHPKNLLHDLARLVLPRGPIGRVVARGVEALGFVCSED